MTKKRVIRALVSFAAVFCLGQDLFAGSIDYLSNQSADYIRTFSRNGAVEGADIAIYNPAGTAFLKNGLYIRLDNQYVKKVYENDLTGYQTGTYDGTYKTTKPTPILPSFFVIYKENNWAAYLTASACGGGGRVEYNSGVPTFAQIWGKIYKTALSKGYSSAAAAGAANAKLGGQLVPGSAKLNALIVFPQATVGGSYKINDYVSASAGVRGVWGIKQYQGRATYGSTLQELDADESAFGATGIFGVMVRPVKDLNIAARYETQTIMNWKTRIHNGKNFQDLLFRNGESRRKDLPAMTGLGASYTIFERLTATASFDGFFIGQADQHTDDENDSVYSDGYNDSYKKFGWEGSLSLEYAVIKDFLKISAGYMKARIGGNPDTYNDFDFSLDSNTYCGGLKLSPAGNLDVIIGVSDTRYISSREDTTGYIYYRKDAKVFACGVEYKMQ